MAITASDLQDAIRTALFVASSEWGENQCDALKEVANGVGEYSLSTMPAIFQASAWLGAAVGTAKALFPAIETVVSKYSLPLTMAGLITDGLQKAYGSEDDRLRTLRGANVQALKNAVEGEVLESADDLVGSTFGRQGAELLFEILRYRLNDPIFDKTMALTHCKHVIRHSLIESKPSEVLERTQKGFGAMCKKINDVYQTLTYGHHLLWRLDPNVQVCYQHIVTKKPMELYDPRDRRMTYCGPGRDLIGEGSGLSLNNPNARDQILTILANICDYDTHGTTSWTETQTYIWPLDKPKTIAELASEYAKGSGARDIGILRGNIEQADRDCWERSKKRAA
ncbi:MAG: hypothetical protein HY308_16080 [Gammaproteobacteria bacterium]|nr:hypothetical protein [Gammaproteobacteria bacterium]